MKKFRIADMTSPEYEKAAKSSPGIIIPLGSVEVLGKHGPLGADWFAADAVSGIIAERTGFLAAPALPYGDTLELAGWPGTVHVPADTLRDLCLAVARSLASPNKGAKRAAFLACHSMNVRAADAACRTLRLEGVSACIADWWKTVFAAYDELTVERPELFPNVDIAPKGHGGDAITRVIMALRSGSVDLGAAANETPKPSLAFHGPRTITSGGPFYTYGGFGDYCDSGAWGDASRANADKGLLVIERAVEKIAVFLEEFAKTT